MRFLEVANSTSAEHCELPGSKTKGHISCFQGLAAVRAYFGSLLDLAQLGFTNKPPPGTPGGA